MSLFTETVDWQAGDDAQRWSLVPITAEEFERVAATVDSSVDTALRLVHLHRRSPLRDYPTGGDSRVTWASGSRA